MLQIKPQIEPADIKTTADTHVKLIYVIDVLYKSVNLGCLRGQISFSVAAELQRNVDTMVAICESRKKAGHLPDNMIDTLVRLYDVLASHVEILRGAGTYNIRDAVIINNACVYFKKELLQTLKDEIPAKVALSAPSKTVSFEPPPTPTVTEIPTTPTPTATTSTTPPTPTVTEIPTTTTPTTSSTPPTITEPTTTTPPEPAAQLVEQFDATD
jgi:hypothetical protein